MPIQESDIKLVATQVMDDVPDGGGAPTSKVIEDGKSNAIFKDISAVDRAQGDVSIVEREPTDERARAGLDLRIDPRTTYVCA